MKITWIAKDDNMICRLWKDANEKCWCCWWKPLHGKTMFDEWGYKLWFHTKREAVKELRKPHITFDQNVIYQLAKETKFKKIIEDEQQ
jgi:hypothetical protein